MNAVDTNVLLYTRDPRDPRKRAIAAELMRSLPDGVLLWQVACEYIASARKLIPFGFSPRLAADHVAGLSDGWRTELPAWPVLHRGAELMSQYSLSIWDALLIAACLSAGVTRLYTEDLQSGLRIDSLEIVDPTLPTLRSFPSIPDPGTAPA